jgi:hypothetical protein
VVPVPGVRAGREGRRRVNRVRVIGGPDKASIGQTGTVRDPEPDWSEEEMVFVTLDNGLDGLWWPEDLKETP